MVLVPQCCACTKASQKILYRQRAHEILDDVFPYWYAVVSAAAPLIPGGFVLKVTLGLSQVSKLNTWMTSRIFSTLQLQLLDRK